MTTIEIKKVIDTKGNVHMYVNGEVPNSSLSRMLTGVDSESDLYGVFNVVDESAEILFHYGVYQESFTLRATNKYLDIETYSANLKHNIDLLKGWIRKCRSKAKTEIVHIDID